MQKTRIILEWIISSMLDAAFLIAWAAVQHLGSVVIAEMNLEGIDSLTLFVLQILFAVATILPILIWIYADVRIMWIKANMMISKKKGE